MSLPVFDWPAYVEREEEIGFDVLTTKFESGKEQKRLKRNTGRRKFNLKFKEDQVDAEEIYAFFKARKGSFEKFNWTDPRTGNTITVRFGVDNLSMSELSTLLFTFSLPLVEVL